MSETNQNPMTEQKPHGGQARNPEEFWKRPEVKRARRYLDVWASWRHAMAHGADCPTMDAVLGDQKTVPPWITDPKELDRAWKRLQIHPNQTVRMLSPVMMVGISVEVALRDEWLGEFVPVLLRLYPRQGLYQVSAVEFFGRSGKYAQRRFETVERAAVYAVLNATRGQ